MDEGSRWWGRLHKRARGADLPRSRLARPDHLTDRLAVVTATSA